MFSKIRAIGECFKRAKATVIAEIVEEKYGKQWEVIRAEGIAKGREIGRAKYQEELAQLRRQLAELKAATSEQPTPDSTEPPSPNQADQP